MKTFAEACEVFLAEINETKERERLFDHFEKFRGIVSESLGDERVDELSLGIARLFAPKLRALMDSWHSENATEENFQLFLQTMFAFNLAFAVGVQIGIEMERQDIPEPM